MSTEQNLLSREFMSVLTRVLGRPQQALALHKPEFKGNEWAYVKECIDTGWVSSVGKYVDEFERRLAAMTGARHAIAVVNGTAALHVALQVVGVRSGDEVLVPALSFVGTANAVAHAGGIPHFVDSHSDTLGMDADALDRYLAEIAERSVHGLHHRRTGGVSRPSYPCTLLVTLCISSVCSRWPTGGACLWSRTPLNRWVVPAEGVTPVLLGVSVC